MKTYLFQPIIKKVIPLGMITFLLATSICQATQLTKRSDYSLFFNTNKLDKSQLIESKQIENIYFDNSYLL